MINSMNISELINLKLLNNSNFVSEQIKTDVINGTVTGIKIHKLKKDGKLIDGELQNKLEALYHKYGSVFVTPVFNSLKNIVGSEGARRIMRKYYVYGDRDKIRHDLYTKDLVYIIEIEVTKEESVKLGDKLSNRHAAKGVVSLILPSELRPYGEITGEPIDILYNPFGM